MTNQLPTNMEKDVMSVDEPVTVVEDGGAGQPKPMDGLDPITQLQTLFDAQSELFFTSIGVLQRDAALVVPTPSIAKQEGQPLSSSWTREQLAHNQRLNKELSLTYAQNLASIQSSIQDILHTALPTHLPHSLDASCQEKDMRTLVQELHIADEELAQAYEEACSLANQLDETLEHMLNRILPRP